MKYSKFAIVIFSVLFTGCCANASAAGKEGGEAEEGMEWQTEFAVSAACEENIIVISEPSDKTVLNEIAADCEVYKVFVNMTDEKNGCMMYCSIPGFGERKEVFYITNDRWNTYSKMDEVVLIDECDK